MIDHFFSAVGGNFDDSGIHANGVFRTSLDTEAAENTNAKIDIEANGKFLNVRIWVLSGHDVNAAGRTSRFTHHAGHTAWRTIFPHG